MKLKRKNNDKIIEGLSKDNDEFYIQHKQGTNVYTLRKEN